MPSIERLIQDADARAASITVPERDEAFVARNRGSAYAYARTWSRAARTPIAPRPA